MLAFKAGSDFSFFKLQSVMRFREIELKFSLVLLSFHLAQSEFKDKFLHVERNILKFKGYFTCWYHPFRRFYQFFIFCILTMKYMLISGFH